MGVSLMGYKHVDYTMYVLKVKIILLINTEKFDELYEFKLFCLHCYEKLIYFLS